MKTIAELQALRDEMKSKVGVRREGEYRTKILVGMATCGIAAGARPVMLTFLDEIKKRNLNNVTVSQTGCIGMCRLEPMVDVIVPGKGKVTYVKLKPEMVPRIVAEHVVNGRVVDEYTIGAADAEDKK